MTVNREIVLDTETTGLYAKSGDKIVEIGCVEIINKVRTGRVYHVYINPQKTISEESIRIHGITNDHVKDKPIFSKIAKEFLDFIKNSPLIIHNAGFDISFLNYELASLGYDEISFNRVVDTLTLARRVFPGAPASLDALCKRFNISLNARKQYHGALIDADLLVDVYVELTGGSQSNLDFATPEKLGASIETQIVRHKRDPRIYEISEEEKVNHKLFLERISNPIWNLIDN